MATFPTNPAATTLVGDEIVPLTQGAVDKRTTTQGIADLFRGTTSAPIASATPALSAATGNLVSITGTTTITALGTVATGAEFTLVFAGVLVLTHNATSLILPTGANITTAAGDVAVVVSLGAGNWRCVGYERADGTPLVGGGGGMSNPMTTAGDVIIGGTAGAPVRLAAGTSTHVLTSNGAGVAPSYQAAGGSFTGGSLTTAINWAKGSDIASAATTNIGAATGNFVHITGTTTITALGTIQAGTPRVVRFAGILTLTHNATSLILPSAANIVTAANDTAVFVSEGSGNWRCVGYERASGAALVGGGGGLTHWTEAVNTTAPNAIVPVVSFTATNAASDVDAALIAKAAGATLAQISDSAVAGGNKRGSRATDFQKIRTTAAQVASGGESVVGGGRGNTASGTNSTVAGGISCIASGTGSFAAGTSATASGIQSVALGGTNGTATGTNAVSLAGGTANAESAVVIGATGATATAHGVQSAYVEGVMYGAAQRTRYTLHGATTSATPVTLTTETGAAAANNQVFFGSLNNRSGIYRGMVIARQPGNTGGKKTWEFVAHLDRDNGTLALVAAVTPTVVADSGVGWSVAVTANDTLKTLRVEATGAAATTVNWACYIHGQEVAG